jgi:hypothetical protein
MTGRASAVMNASGSRTERRRPRAIITRVSLSA